MSHGVKIYIHQWTIVKSAVKGEVEVGDEVSLTATDDRQLK